VLAPTDPPDVHNGAMECIRTLRQRVRLLEDSVDAAHARACDLFVHAEALALVAETLLANIGECRDDAPSQNWHGPYEELEPVEEAIEAFREAYPKPAGGA
jgi:hypothetical protein